MAVNTPAPEDGEEDDYFDVERMREDLQEALDDLHDAIEEYEEAEEYFEGTVGEKFSSRQLQRLLSGSSSDFNVNLASRVVYAVTDRLEIAAVTAVDKNESLPPLSPGQRPNDSEDGSEAPSGDSSAKEIAEQNLADPVDNSGGASSGSDSGEEGSRPSKPGEVDKSFNLVEEEMNDVTRILNENVWHHNEMDIEAPEIHEKTAIYGDAYLFVWDAEEFEEELEVESDLAPFKKKPASDATKAPDPYQREKESSDNSGAESSGADNGGAESSGASGSDNGFSAGSGQEERDEAALAIRNALTPPEEEKEESVDNETAAGSGTSKSPVATDRKVDMFFNSPFNTRIIYDEENPRKKKFAIKKWEVGRRDRKRVRLNLYYDDKIVKLISTSKSEGLRAEDYQPYLDDPEVDEYGVMENPHGVIPIFHFRTARPYGRPEHKNAYGPQDAITKLVANMMSTVDFAAYPQRWALAADDTTLDDDLDWGDDLSENPGDKESELVSGPGRVWQLQNMKEVGEFKAADMQQFIQPLDKMIEMMASSTGTPLSYLHKVKGTSSTPLSGASQKQTEVMLLKKIAARQRSFAATWRDAMQFAMKLLGFDVRVTVQWDSIQVANDKETWEAVQIQQQVGVPEEQTLMEAGYTKGQVDKWKESKTKNMPPAMQMMANAPLPAELQANQLQPGQRPPGAGNPAAQPAAQPMVVQPPKQ